ncbi:MAG: DUF2304 domain-containing protein [Faecalimonas sp.]|nr:DUF2304 domain-containing protein [Faecalimonas sp.]
MGIVLRLVLIGVSVLTFIYVIHKVRKSQMKIEGAIFWFLLAGLIMLFAFFPILAHTAANLLGIESPSNFIFLLMIFLLIIKNFSLSLKEAKLEHKIEILTAEIAIWRNETEKNNSNE